MNIAFDAGAIEIGRGSGIGNYTLNQFARMIKQTPENQYFYFNIVGDSNLVDSIQEENFHKCVFYAGKESLLRQYNGRYQDVYGEVVKAFIREYQIDVFYITSPFFSENVLYKKEWFEGVTVVATAWDIIPYVMRDCYLKDPKVFSWYMTCIDMLRWTDRQLAISNSVKEDMVRYLDFDSEKIDIIYGGVSDQFHEIQISTNEKKELFRKFGIQAEYVLCCVSADERKNVRGAVEAFARMPHTLTNNYQLVIVGRMLPEKKVEFNRLIASLHMTGRIVLTDYVTDHELLALYNLAKLMIFPSLYEGFGLPALEAWACGTPVIASQNSSLGEIVGDAGLLFDPHDIKDIAKTMEAALTTADLNELLVRGQEKAKKYTWDWVAELSLDAIHNTVTKKRTDSNRQGKIALIYPPVDLGEIWGRLPALLAERFQLDVYTDYAMHMDPISWNVFSTEELAMHSVEYDWLVVVAPEPVIGTMQQSVLAAGKSIWLIADELLEQLLRKAFGLELLEEKTVSDAGQARLSRFFNHVDVENGLPVFNKIVTASDEQRKALVEQSINQTVYLVDPSSGYGIEQINTSEALYWALMENLRFAIKDIKPWDSGKEWDKGECLIDELGVAIAQKDYCYDETARFAHTLGYAFSGEPRWLISPKEILADKEKHKEFQVDFVTSWNTKCGIAEFTRFYYESVKNQVDISVYPNMVEEVVRKDELFVKGRFWKFHDNPARLVGELLKSSAPIVHIQYTEGFFRVEDLVMLLNGVRGKKVVITCHNTAFLAPNNEQESEILNQAVYVVHQEKDRQQLIDSGLLEKNIHLIPHGQVTFPKIKREDVRRRLGIVNSDPVIGSYGFLFAHKGILETIRAIAQLKDEYPNILYIPCCSIYSGSLASTEYYQLCQNEIVQLGLEKNVCMVSDFLDAKESAYILQACDVTVMAYGDTQESASGAICFCIAAERPLITTQQDIFREFENCTLQIHDNAPHNIARAIRKVLDGENADFYKKNMRQKIEEKSWRNIGKMYLNIYRKLLSKG